MRDGALALAGLMLAGVVAAMLAGLAILWATGCKEPPAPHTSAVTTTSEIPLPPGPVPTPLPPDEP